jgi:O-antigen/teichoic acid export membrane protein
MPQSSQTTDTAVLFAGRLAGFAVTFAVPLVLVRVFSTADFGLYKQLFLIQGTLAPILALGFPASLFYFVPRRPEERPTYVVQTLVVLLASGLLGGGALLALRSPVALALNNPEIELYLPWIALFLVIFLVAVPLENVMVVSKQVQLASAAGFLSDLARGTLRVGGPDPEHARSRIRHDPLGRASARGAARPPHETWDHFAAAAGPRASR